MHTARPGGGARASAPHRPLSHALPCPASHVPHRIAGPRPGSAPQGNATHNDDEITVIMNHKWRVVWVCRLGQRVTAVARRRHCYSLRQRRPASAKLAARWRCVFRDSVTCAPLPPRPPPPPPTPPQSLLRLGRIGPGRADRKGADATVSAPTGRPHTLADEGRGLVSAPPPP